MAKTEHLLSLGGRIALNFANVPSLAGQPLRESLSWEELIAFLEASRIISAERREQLLLLPQTDPQSADGLLSQALRLRNALRDIFGALLDKEHVESKWAETINSVLRITEGHDELVREDGEWRLEFVARENGLVWLLAAVARSAAEILAEGRNSSLRACANPNCGLFFYDKSRTHKRRWCSMSLCGNRHKVAAFARRHSLRSRAASA